MSLNVLTRQHVCKKAHSFDNFFRGGEDPAFPEKSEIGYCYTGYTGNACGVCQRGWAKFGSKLYFVI